MLVVLCLFLCVLCYSCIVFDIWCFFVFCARCLVFVVRCSFVVVSCGVAWCLVLIVWCVELYFCLLPGAYCFVCWIVVLFGVFLFVFLLLVASFLVLGTYWFEFGIWCSSTCLLFHLLTAYRYLLFGCLCTNNESLAQSMHRALRLNLPIQAPFLTTEMVLWFVQLVTLRVHSLSYVFPSEPHTGSLTPTQRSGHTQLPTCLTTLHVA